MNFASINLQNWIFLLSCKLTQSLTVIFCWWQRGGVWQSTFYNVKLTRCWRSEIFLFFLSPADWSLLDVGLCSSSCVCYYRPGYDRCQNITDQEFNTDWTCLAMNIFPWSLTRESDGRWPYSTRIIVWKVVNYSCEIVNACFWLITDWVVIVKSLPTLGYNYSALCTDHPNRETEYFAHRQPPPPVRYFSWENHLSVWFQCQQTGAVNTMTDRILMCVALQHQQMVQAPRTWRYQTFRSSLVDYGVMSVSVWSRVLASNYQARKVILSWLSIICFLNTGRGGPATFWFDIGLEEIVPVGGERGLNL